MRKFSTNAIQQILTLMNTLGVSITYFDSIINFPWHIHKSDHPLTDCKEDWEVYVVAMATILCVFIAINNQRIMPEHIAKFMNQVFKNKNFSAPKTTHTSKDAVVEAVGCVAKASISTLSLYSSLQDYMDNSVVAALLSSISFLGNLLAIFSVLMEHRKDRDENPWRLNLPRPWAKGLAGFVKICYGLAQGGIYSNAILNPFVMTGVLPSRPAYNSPDSLGRVIFGAMLYPSIEFMWGSGTSMYIRTLKVFGSEEKEVKSKVTICQKWRGGVASVFRSLALISSIFCFFYLLSNGNMWASTIPAVLSVLAAPGVFALLYPPAEPEEELCRLRGNSHIYLSKSPLLINSSNPENSQSEGYSFESIGAF